jgi:hypothetical protein
MKKYRRIEISVFRKKVTIVSSGLDPTIAEGGPGLGNTKSGETIDPVSPEGRSLISETIYLLEKSLAGMDDP